MDPIIVSAWYGVLLEQIHQVRKVVPRKVEVQPLLDVPVATVFSSSSDTALALLLAAAWGRPAEANDGSEKEI